MGNVTMEARDINYRGGETKMSVEDALKSTSGEAAAIAALQEAVGNLQTDTGNLQTTKANLVTIAPVFSAETAYDPGDLAYYNGLAYRCVNAHEGEWDADDFAATTISGELATLKSGLISSIVLSIYGTHDADPFEENASGVTYAIKDNGTVLGYLVVRPKGYLNHLNQPVAIELYNSSWSIIWAVTPV